MFETGAAGRRATEIHQLCKRGKMFTKSIAIAEARSQYDYDENDGFGGSSFIPQSIKADCDEYMKLIGCEFDFHGAQGNQIRLNNVVY